MIDEENTINVNINVEQTIAKNKVRLRYLTETTKSETKIPETVKLEAETIEAV